MSEIGSEFMKNSSMIGNNGYIDLQDFKKRFVLSGRTGLDLISQEIREKTKAYRISVPSYCCGSMVAPFYNQRFDISFYDPFDLEHTVLSESIQVVLIMDYFGFLSDKTFAFASKCKQLGNIVIVDATQTAFSRAKTYSLADYILVSCRKWTDCLGAVVYSRSKFFTRESIKDNTLCNSVWRKAAANKERYIRQKTGKKQEFLSQYAAANRILDEDYSGYRMRPEEIAVWQTVDSAYLRKKRRDNAAYLMKKIKTVSSNYGVKLMFDDMGDEDCPMFVPILLEGNKRKTVRDELIKNNIYCPIHWPIDEKYPYEKTIFHEQELSLICDQRYSIEAMERQVGVLLQALSFLDQ